MPTFNPAAHFYFSTCLRLEDDETVTHHSILETLTRNENSEDNILAALRNIILCDSPFQIYSFPFVLEQLDKIDNHSPRVSNILSDYFAIFTGLFESASDINILVNELIFTKSAADTGKRLIKLCDSLLLDGNSSDMFETLTPYIDIIECEKEAVVLTLINHFCLDRGVANFLIEEIGKNPDNKINKLIESAYTHAKGRMCFVLAVDTKRHLELLDSKEEFKRHIWSNKRVSNSPDLEPDIVFLFLTYWFLYFEKKNTDEQKIQKLKKELCSFDFFGNLIIYFNVKARREFFTHNNFVQYLRILYGGEVAENSKIYEKNLLGVNIWIGSIFLVVSEYFDTDTSCLFFEELWQPITLNDDGIILGSQFSIISDDFASIISGKSGWPTREKKSSKNNLKILSPWLTPINVYSPKRSYIGLDVYGNWLRTLYAVKVSETFLRKLKSTKKGIFNQYMIHVSELLTYSSAVVSKNLYSDEKDKSKISLFEKLLSKPNLRKILLILDRDVNTMYGQKNIWNTNNDSLFFLLDANPTNSHNLKYFYKHVTPKILYYWLYYSLQKRTIDIDVSCLKEHLTKLESTEGFVYKSRLKALRKLLFFEDFENVEECKNEHDKIILSKDRSIDDIPKYSRDIIMGNSNDSKKETLDRQIAIACLIKRYHYTLVSSSYDVSSYIDDLSSLLKSIRGGSDLSYLNRFSLIFLFNEFEKIDSRNSNLFQLIIEVLFELNGSLDISLLVVRIFEKFVSMESTKPNEQQIEVLNCLSNCISIAIKYNIHDRENTDKPKDPMQNILQNKRIEFLQNSLNTVQYLACKYRDQNVDRIRVLNYSNFNSGRFEVFNTDVSVRNSIPHFSEPQIVKEIPTKQLALVTYNVNEQIGKLYYNNIPLPKGTINFFELSENELNDVLKQKSKRYLIVAKCTGFERVSKRFQFEYATGKVKTQIFFRNYFIKQEELVQLKFFYSISDQDWVIDRNYCVKIVDTEDKYSFRKIVKIDDINKGTLPLDYWLPSHSDLFTGFIEKELQFNNGIFISPNKEGKPQFLMFNKLIDEASKYNQFLVLTFISREWDTTRQEYGYLFYLTFNQCYLIFEDELSFPQSESFTFLKYLQNVTRVEDEDVSSLNGLLISFKISFLNTVVKLELLDNSSNITDDIASRFPSLQVPFDDRNVKWNQLFNSSEGIELTAKRNGSKWFFDIGDKTKWDNLGFNNSIEVTFDKSPGQHDIIDFFYYKGWTAKNSRFNCHVSGTIIERKTIDKSQLRSYLQLKEGSPIELKAFYSFRRKDASAQYFSKENFRVNINLEELTFKPINIEEFNFGLPVKKGAFVISNITDWREIGLFGKGLVLSIESASLLEQSNSEKIIGYFISVPKKNQAVTSYKVVLENSLGGLSDEITVEIENVLDEVIQRNLDVYIRFEGKLIDNKWQVKLFSRQIFLNSIRDLQRIRDFDLLEFDYIGKTNIADGLVYLYEESDYSSTLYYSHQCYNELPANYLFDGYDKVSANWIPQTLGNNSFRIGFTQKQLVVTGNINRKNSHLSIHNATLQSINFRFENFSNGKYFVKRVFFVGIQEQLQQKVVSVSDSFRKEQENQTRIESLKEYFKDPYPLEGSITKSETTVLIEFPASPSSVKNPLNMIPDNEGWSNEVQLENPTVSIENLIYVPSAILSYKKSDITFWLQMINDKQIYATFRLGYKTINEWFIEENFSPREIVNASSFKLFYVQKEKIHPITNEVYAKEMYRFEYGFGKNLLIPEDQLLWNGNPINTTDFFFFHGDAIRTFNFAEDSDVRSQKIKLNILSIEKSQAHRLYLQAGLHNIYHLVNISSINNKIRVNYVIGVDETTIGEAGMSFNYDKVLASFDPSSEKNLLERFSRDSSSADRTVLAKVNTNEFSKSGSLEFNLYKLSFIGDNIEEGIRCIKGTARVLMKLGSIKKNERTGNDYLIEVFSNDLLDKSDIGADFRKGVILRRPFSLYEAFLREYFRRGDIDAFSKYEAYVTVQSGVNNRVSFSLIANSSFRSENALLGYIKLSKNVICISKENSSISEQLVLEVKPGNFISINPEHFKFVGIEYVKERDVLCITHDGRYFIVESAAAGDYRFIQKNRMVVVLPKDTVFRNPDVSTGISYTLGGFPNVDIDFQDRSIEKRNEFLLSHHPKIASVNKFFIKNEEFHCLRTRFDEEQLTFGHILINERTFELKFAANQSQMGEQIPIEWHSVSFFDESASEIIKRIKRCRWRYHDEQSQNFIKGKSSYHATEPYPLLQSSVCKTDDKGVISGPVFCEFNGQSINLRVSTKLTSWGFPVSSLIDFLDIIKGEYTFAYIGKEDNIHFIEIAPGRIVELPVNLLVLRSNAIEISMKNYAWDFLSTGDEITLKNIAGDLSDMFKIQLISIKHSTRNVFRRGVCKLPIFKIDQAAGLIILGSNISNIKMPIENRVLNLKPGNLVLFYPFRNIIGDRVQDAVVNPNDLIYVSVTSDRHFCIRGFDNLEVNYCKPNYKNEALNMIIACGGAIPGIVTRKEGDSQIQFEFPTLRSSTKLLNGNVLSACIAGVLGDSAEKIILKIGGFFEVIPSENIISGIPKQHRQFVLQSLINERVWIRMIINDEDKSYSLMSGLKSDLDSEIYVNKAKHVVDDNNLFLGSICRSISSQQLFWMPEKEMAWCNVNLEIADAVFYNGRDISFTKNQISIKVKLCKGKDGNYISRIRTSDIHNSFSKKKCGTDKIEVIPINDSKQISGLQFGFTGYSVIHKILLSCTFFDGSDMEPPQLFKNIQTEVVEKDVKNLKMKTLLGEKKILVRLPIGPKRVIVDDSYIDHVFTKCQESDYNVFNDRSGIIRSYDFLFTSKWETKVSLKTSLLLLKLFLLMYKEGFSDKDTLSKIRNLLTLIKLNLLRHVCIDVINMHEPYKSSDRYYDAILREFLDPFYSKESDYFSEYFVVKFKRIAEILCFQSNDTSIVDKNYSAIGNAILQALGQDSTLDMNVLEKSLMYSFYKKLNLFSISYRKKDVTKYIDDIDNIVNNINVNKLNFMLLNETWA